VKVLDLKPCARHEVRHRLIFVFQVLVRHCQVLLNGVAQIGSLGRSFVAKQAG
jgi:hypothetical protein